MYKKDPSWDGTSLKAFNLLIELGKSLPVNNIIWMSNLFGYTLGGNHFYMKWNQEVRYWSRGWIQNICRDMFREELGYEVSLYGTRQVKIFKEGFWYHIEFFHHILVVYLGLGIVGHPVKCPCKPQVYHISIIKL